MADRQEESGSKTIYVVSLLLGFVSFGVQVAAVVTPAWLVLDLKKSTLGLVDWEFSMGLWFVNYCQFGKCDTAELSDFWDNVYSGIGVDVSHSMIEYRIESLIGAVTITAVVVCLSKLACCSGDGIYKSNKIFWIIICGCSGVSAVVSLTAAGKYGRSVADAHGAWEKIGLGESPYKVPYSIILEGVGGLIAGLVFLIMLIETVRAMNRINAGIQRQAYAMSPYPVGNQPYGNQPNAAQQPYTMQYSNPQGYGNQQYGMDVKQPPVHYR